MGTADSGWPSASANCSRDLLAARACGPGWLFAQKDVDDRFFGARDNMGADEFAVLLPGGGALPVVRCR
jgi:hypothetical protein